ncbi:DUF4312 family protein [Salmonella enterica subsp. enterica serovar Montevideo]|nr:DUF4312 family protein [Salmonella enterica subsp. enterica serovar Montevideo]
MMKEQFTTTVRVKGKGDAKARAFADALNHVQSAVMRESPYILLRIEPQDVRIVQAHESVRKEAFLFFDAPRDKCTLSCAINGIHAAFHYLKKNYISGCVMTVPTGW